MCDFGPRNANKSVTCLEELVARCPSLSEEDEELYTFITDRVAGFKAETVDMCKYYYCCCCYCYCCYSFSYHCCYCCCCCCCYYYYYCCYYLIIILLLLLLLLLLL